MNPTKMQKIVGVAISSERRDLVKTLTKLGCVEIAKGAEIDGALAVNVGKSKDEAVLKLAKISFARDFIFSQRELLLKDKNFKKTKYPLIQRKPEIEYDEFESLKEREREFFDDISAMETFNAELVELKTLQAKSKTKYAQVEPFVSFSLPLNNYKDTRNTICRLGTVNSKKVDALTALEEAIPMLTVEHYDINGILSVCIVCHKDEWSAVSEKLTEFDFAEVSIGNFNTNAHELQGIERMNQKVTNERILEIARNVVDDYDNAEFLNKIKLTEDFYNVEMQMLEAEEMMSATDKAYVFEGWMPDTVAEKVDNVLTESNLAISYIIRDAIEGEMQPTLLMDNAIVTPYHAVTNMFNVPSVNEVNPNPFVAFFFILFFGIMISDAGYGIILTIITGVILAIARPRRNEMSLLKVIFMGGISTIFWGIMFGGYFGISAELLGLEKLAILFNPIDEPMMMLFLSLGLGLVQMMTGMAINAYSLFKQHKPLDAIFGVFSWYFLIIGIAMFLLGGGNNGVKYTGIVLLVMGIGGMLVAGALHKKGLKTVSGALGNLYSIIGFFSDLLSYTRLFGLGLATGVIAMVFNEMAGVIIGLNKVIGLIAAPFILVVGHVFNICINTLGAYVHNSRLQFVEFFNKFYTGGGELFHPLGSDMKNYNFVQQEEEQ